MKEKDALVDFKPHELILYVEKDDGTYGPLKTGAFIGREFGDSFFENRGIFESRGLEKVEKNEISMIDYYMMLHELTDAEVAMRVGTSRQNVKKHRKPGYFPMIKLSLLKKYAEVFGVTVADMFHTIGSNKSSFAVSVEKTHNEFFVVKKITEIKREQK